MTYTQAQPRLNRAMDRCHAETMATTRPDRMLKWSKRYIRLNTYMRACIAAEFHSAR